MNPILTLLKILYSIVYQFCSTSFVLRAKLQKIQKLEELHCILKLKVNRKLTIFPSELLSYRRLERVNPLPGNSRRLITRHSGYTTRIDSVFATLRGASLQRTEANLLRELLFKGGG